MTEPTEFKCLVCGKPLRTFDHYDDQEPWKSWFDGADTWEIVCNYGSRFDTDKFILVLCDDCIQAKIDAGLLIPHGSLLW